MDFMMPSATEELRAKFPGDDREAIDILTANFVIGRGGNIYPVVKGYKPTLREEEALDYLFHEWDYTYTPELPF